MTAILAISQHSVSLAYKKEDDEVEHCHRVTAGSLRAIAGDLGGTCPPRVENNLASNPSLTASQTLFILFLVLQDVEIEVNYYLNGGS